MWSRSIKLTPQGFCFLQPIIDANWRELLNRIKERCNYDCVMSCVFFMTMSINTKAGLLEAWWWWWLLGFIIWIIGPLRACKSPQDKRHAFAVKYRIKKGFTNLRAGHVVTLQALLDWNIACRVYCKWFSSQGVLGEIRHDQKYQQEALFMQGDPGFKSWTNIIFLTKVISIHIHFMEKSIFSIVILTVFHKEIVMKYSGEVGKLWQI